ncbi:SLC13 family permease [Brevibacillus marinus]|uniref:SLC13 family permease n=1 Tax=Brevibacillus marinus TaxID=2496837 RepID=UPI000F848E4B|nr:SLC13 family permease [Brevibacillus marinus]
MKARTKMWVVGSAFLILLIGISWPTPETMNAVQQRSIVLLMMSILLWSTEALPIGISSLLIVGLQLALGLAESFPQSVEGFLSSAIYFIIVVTMLNQAMIRVGLDRIIARYLMSLAKGSIQRTAIVVTLAVMILPILMPSAVSRLKMFIPLIEQINARYGLAKGSNLVRFCLWSFGGLNQVTTLVVLTGGGFAILASQYFANLGEPISWSRWFLLMAPPVYVCVILTSIVMWFYWKIGRLKPQPATGDTPGRANEKADGQPDGNRSNLLVTSIVMLGVLAAWILGSQWGIPSIVPPIIALAVLALPPLRIVSDEDLRHQDWDSFLFIGSAISLSTTLERNGTVDWVSAHVLAPVSASLPWWVGLLLFVVYVLLFRMAFVSPSSAMTVVLPLALSYATAIGLPQLDALMTAILFIGGSVILPIHSPTMFIAYQTGYFTMKDQWVIGSALLVNLFIASFLASWLIW